MRSSRRPPRAVTAGRPMERNALALTMVRTLQLTPEDPAWKKAQALRSKSRRHERRQP